MRKSALITIFCLLGIMLLPGCQKDGLEQKKVATDYSRCWDSSGSFTFACLDSFLIDYYGEKLLDESKEKRTFHFLLGDLSAEGRGEVILYSETPPFEEVKEGEGDLLIVDHDFKVMRHYKGISVPLLLLSESTEFWGWRDLAFKSEKGWVRLVYGDEGYPQDPHKVQDILPKIPRGAEKFFSEDSRQKGLFTVDGDGGMIDWSISS